MAQITHNLQDSDLCNLLEVTKVAAITWLDHLKSVKSSDYKTMRSFIIALNQAKTNPVSHQGNDLIDSFEIVLTGLGPKAKLIIRFATYLIEKNAVRMPST